MMSKSLSSGQPLGPLSVGNVVSAALRIYRDRFLAYYKLAFTAYLWVIVPVYGWAKFAMISGLISRLAYQEVIESPETVKEARRHVNPRLWTFFGVGLLVGLILFFSMILYGMLVSIFSSFFQLSQGSDRWIIAVLFALFVLVALLAFLFGYTWLYSRMSLAEMPVAIEENSSATKAINRSWKLTKGLILHLMLVYFIAFLITTPISGLMQILISIIQAVLSVIVSTESPIFFIIYFIFLLLINFAGGALFVPFWQAIKAVIYYDLRSRKEGIDLNLRES